MSCHNLINFLEFTTNKLNNTYQLNNKNSYVICFDIKKLVKELRSLALS